MDNSFLGRGWSFPPAFTGGGLDVDMVSDEEDIRQSLEILLSTHAGERILLPGFGSDLGSYVFEEVDQALVTRLADTISDAILLYESRISMEKIDIVQSSHDNGLLMINLYYVIKAVNSRYNMVFPFYINEATHL